MLKRFHQDVLLLVAAIILFLAALVLPMACALANDLSQEERRLQQAYATGDLIRLHVIANSDSPRDQAIKLCVRDALLKAFGDLLRTAGADSSDAVFAVLTEQVDAMQQTAQTRARELGFDGGVTAEVGLMELPAKTYGQIILPKGEYRALRITLGSGGGQNWWCVLFPQLCLALAQDEAAESPSIVQWASMRIFKQWIAFPGTFDFPVQGQGNMI